VTARGAGHSGPPLRSRGNAGGSSDLMLLAIRNCFSLGGIDYMPEALDSVCSGVAGAVGSAGGDVDVRQNGRYIGHVWIKTWTEMPGLDTCL